jgi:hypothetical protein
MTQYFHPESSHATSDVDIVDDELHDGVGVLSEHDGDINHNLKLLTAPI